MAHICTGLGMVTCGTAHSLPRSRCLCFFLGCTPEQFKGVRTRELSLALPSSRAAPGSWEQPEALHLGPAPGWDPCGQRALASGQGRGQGWALPPVAGRNGCSGAGACGSCPAACDSIMQMSLEPQGAAASE